MTVAELGALIRGVAPALRDYVVASQKSLDERLTALETQDLLPGKDGAPGPPGESGAAGQPGRDGGLDQLKVGFDGERTLTVCFKNGDPIQGGVLTFPVMIYRGVYVGGKTYDLGDVTTWAGSTWHCQKSTTSKPGEGLADWQLMVKRGRDGRDGAGK